MGKVFLAEGTASTESQRLCSGTCREQESEDRATLEEEGEVLPNPSMPLEGGDWVLLWDGTIGGTISVIPGLRQCGVEEPCAGNNEAPGRTGGGGHKQNSGAGPWDGEEGMGQGVSEQRASGGLAGSGACQAHVPDFQLDGAVRGSLPGEPPSTGSDPSGAQVNERQRQEPPGPLQ